MLSVMRSIQSYGTIPVSEPDQCPICHRSIDPVFVSGYVGGRVLPGRLRALYRCPSQECFELFLVYFEHLPSQGASGVARVLRCVPEEPLAPNFSDFVKEVSSSYCEIYVEAHKAEAWGLLQICGVAYRKALEFLIKDYLKVRRPDDAKAIEKALLGPCIENYVTDPNVKAVSKRAVWLGNDETHYTKKWIEKDLKDLKILLELVLRWIETEHLTQEAMDSMPDPHG